MGFTEVLIVGAIRSIGPTLRGLVWGGEGGGTDLVLGTHKSGTSAIVYIKHTIITVGMPIYGRVTASDARNPPKSNGPPDCTASSKPGKKRRYPNQ